MSSSMPKDPVSTRGEWVERSEFSRRKSFGYFTCNNGSCSGKTLVSAHAFRQYKQACTSCKPYTFPTYLWVNLEERKEARVKGDEEKPHCRRLCEACKLGVCLR
jgi:hypothetical protein